MHYKFLHITKFQLIIKMSKIVDNLSLDNPVFSAYLFWSSVLIIKTLVMAFLTVIKRVKNKVRRSIYKVHKINLTINYSQAVATKEDSPKGIVRFSDDVERQRRAHLNDLENIPVFIINAFLFVISSPSAFIAINLFRIFTITRILHTIVHAVINLQPQQPLRAILFLCGLMINLYMAINSVIYYF